MISWTPYFHCLRLEKDQARHDSEPYFFGQGLDRGKVVRSKHNIRNKKDIYGLRATKKHFESITWI